MSVVADWHVKIFKTGRLINFVLCFLSVHFYSAVSRAARSKDVMGNNVATTPISDNVASAVFMQDWGCIGSI